MNGWNEKLEARAKAIRSRAAIQAWEIRQQGLARGTWFELERLLALTSRAWALSEEGVRSLLVTGHKPQDAGLRLQPPRHIFVIEAGEIANLADAREIAVTLSAEIVSTPALALLPFPVEQRRP